MGGNPNPTPQAVQENKSAADALRAELGFAVTAPTQQQQQQQPGTERGNVATPVSARSGLLKRKAEIMEEEQENGESDYSSPPTPIPKVNNGVVEDVQDTVRLWEPGHKERYYEQKFHVDYHKDVEFRRTYTLMQ